MRPLSFRLLVICAAAALIFSFSAYVALQVGFLGGLGAAFIATMLAYPLWGRYHRFDENWRQARNPDPAQRNAAQQLDEDDARRAGGLF